MFGVLGDFLLSKRMEQRVCIKFGVKNGIQCSKALEMLTIAYGESTVSKKNVYTWYKLFQEGRENVEDEPRPGLSDVLGMRRVSAKFVPKLLNFDQKNRRMTIAQEMLNEVNEDPDFLKRVITGYESWVYGYDVETKAQSSQWKTPEEPTPIKARQVRSTVKVLLTVFFDYRGVVHQEFLPQGHTVNKEYYLEVMRRLREAIRKKTSGTLEKQFVDFASR